MSHSLVETIAKYFEDLVAPEPASSPPPRPPDEYAELEASGSELTRSLSALSDLARAMAQRQEGPATVPGESPEAARKRAEELRIEQERAQMLGDILTMHERLGTGMDREGLGRLGAGLEELLPYMEDRAGADVLERMLACVLRRLYLEAGKLAWEQLTDRMARSQVQWPVPTGLHPRASAEEIEAARALNFDKDREAFLRQEPGLARDMMFGIVKIWKAAYPSPDTYLWTEVVLEGVACGLRIEILERAARIAQEHKGLEKELQDLLAPQLQATRELLSRGLQSPSQLQDLMERTDLLCREQAPDLVWREIQGEVTAAPSPAGTS